MRESDSSPSAMQLRRGPSRAFLGGALLIVGGLALFPLYWLVVMASNTTSSLYVTPPQLLPGTEFFNNIARLLAQVDLPQAFFNSLIVTIAHTVLAVFLCSLAGFVFAKYRFPGHRTLFALLLLTMVIPTGAMLIPQFQVYIAVGWVNTFLPLIIPGAASAYGIFWMRQYAEASVADELIEAARVDGCGLMRTYWHIGLPLLRPALAAFGVFTVIWTWNDYLWPLIVLNDQDKLTLPLALAQMNMNVGPSDYTAVMAGTLAAVAPLIIVFLLMRRTITRNMVAGGVKE